MRILNVIATMDPAAGGACQGIRNTIPKLETMNIHQEVLSLDDPHASFLGQDPFLIHAIGPGKGRWCYSARLIPWLLQYAVNFDALIIHGLWLYPSYAVWKAVRKLKRTGLKVFVMTHGMLDPYFQKAQGRTIKAIRNWFYWKLIENRVLNDATGVCFTCQMELELAREPFRPYRPQKEINVGFGIAVPPVFKEQMRMAFLEHCPEVAHKPYLLFLGRLHPKKGIDLLIKAYMELLKKNGASLPHLVIAGPGLDTNYGQQMAKLVNGDARLKRAVSFTDMLNGDAKWGAFYNCEAFVLPTHQENFGVAIVEAMACGKPVLISNQTNIWKEIIDGGAGLVGSDNLCDTIALIQRWLLLPRHEKRKMGEQAHWTYRQLFAMDYTAKQWVEVLNEQSLPVTSYEL